MSVPGTISDLKGKRGFPGTWVAHALIVNVTFVPFTCLQLAHTHLESPPELCAGGMMTAECGRWPGAVGLCAGCLSCPRPSPSRCSCIIQVQRERYEEFQDGGRRVVSHSQRPWRELPRTAAGGAHHHAPTWLTSSSSRLPISTPLQILTDSCSCQLLLSKCFPAHLVGAVC